MRSLTKPQKMAEPLPPPETFPAWVTPGSHEPLHEITPGVLRNVAGEHFEKQAGIWRFLRPEQQRHYQQFVKEYETVRQAEGRESPDAGYYRALPFCDPTHPLAQSWRIRAISYTALRDRVISGMTKALKPTLRIVDLGAGNGWLSNRLAELGHHVLAVDLTINSFDGLGVCKHYATTFEKIQATFAELPLPDRRCDLVIFNASFHYSEDYRETMAEALRLLDVGGKLVILDSPIYHDATSGERMVRERETWFEGQFGFRSNALASEHFLTFDRIESLAKEFEIKWQFIRPTYGLKWHLKPLLARLRGSREPAKFILLVGEKIL